MPHVTPTVKGLLLINFTAFLIHNILNVDLVDSLGLKCILSDHFRLYQLLTHMFVHANWNHLLSNMFALLTFGTILEHMLGAKMFMALYILTGLGATTLYMLARCLEIYNLKMLYQRYIAQPDPQHLVAYLKHFPYHAYRDAICPLINDFFEYPTAPNYIAQSKIIARQLYTLQVDMSAVGASESVFGIFTSFVMLFPNMAFFVFFIPFPVKIKYALVFYGIYELYAGIRNSPTDSVAHFAHLGGILFAYLLVKWWRKRYRYHYL